MATAFPGGLDSFTNPVATDTLDSVSVPHASQHDNLNDAVAALEAKVGVNGSAVTSSLDYKISHVVSGGGGGPGTFQPFQAWNFDPVGVINSSDVTNPGQLYTTSITVPAMTVTKFYLQMVTNNAGMTHLYGCIWTAAGALVVQSSDGAALYQNAANSQKVIGLTLASTALTAGSYVLGFWGTGVDPLFWRSTSNADLNAGCTTPLFRAGTANTGLTTTAPSTIGTVTSQSSAFWMALG
jgi:hypothetical protein